MQKIKKILYWLVLTVLVLIAGLTAISTLNIPGNYKLLAVQSGSMEPAIKMGSIVVIEPAQDYQKGEIITFADLDNPKNSITHRIEKVKKDDGRLSFVTKGDANDALDSKEVVPGQVLGKMIFSIPFLGYPVSFAKTKEGLIILVIIPAIIIVYSEILNIKKEIKRILKRRNEKQKTKAKKEA